MYTVLVDGFQNDKLAASIYSNNLFKNHGFTLALRGENEVFASPGPALFFLLLVVALAVLSS